MKKILIADRDESLKDAFRVVFPSDEFEILFTSNGREAERMAEESWPEIYILNTRLDEKDGTSVYRHLKERNKLREARFFFIKDEGITADLDGLSTDGVIDKPINFFRVHQMIDKEDALPELKVARRADKKIVPESQLYATTAGEKLPALENELKTIILDAIEGIKNSVVDRATPLVSRYIEEYAREILHEAAERIVREEMDKLLGLLRESRK
jgi:response regulator RpfG family c-di-GMP phosphodiesterase